ncbi:NADPH:quinone reductase-like Zn-dependent oxidoreductase [Maritalea mobilis]|uniref:NADPH:quinone reductase-like Zn-dependent oxidoreductase n=1 Tax=Maritalea mobilis TaxID=483324 RepID=A0A4R6VXR9_9HYPH|nr:NAD(P)-dependent alcohol dehydrogenase [Maritalea mobilis]TDQ67380.1 NADPH:quinone reductase-like Zn-dependent oxidoreductase [Maritalea mobilis]
MKNQTMKTVYYERFGGPEVLQLRDMPIPTPKEDEVRIRVEAVHMSNGDAIARTGKSPWPLMRLPAKLLMGIFKPRNRILGGEFAGVVESVGNKVSKYKPGDRVFGFTDMRFGAMAEFVCLPENAPFMHCPENVSFDDAAAIGGSNAQTAYYFVQQANIKPGDKVLINGASGGIGRVAVQLAKHLGAHVTGTCSAQNKELVLALGADEAIDYRASDFTQQGKKYDVIFDCAGFLPFSKVAPVLTEKGKHLLVMFYISHLLKQRQTKGKGGKEQLCVLAPSSPESLSAIADLLANGALKPVVSHTFSMDQAIEAAKLYDTNQQQGCIIIHPQTWTK